jgi:hypothetical protein
MSIAVPIRVKGKSSFATGTFTHRNKCQRYI